MQVLSFKQTIVLLIVLLMQSPFTQSQILKNTFPEKIGKSRGVPAKPAFVNYKQSDNTNVIIKPFGDAIINWAETKDGYCVLHNASGDLVYAVKDDSGFLIPSKQLAHSTRERRSPEIEFIQNIPRHLRFSEAQKSVLQTAHKFYQNKYVKNPGSFPTTGNPKLLVILANFSDSSPLYTQSQLDQPMNQTNYSGKGCLNEYFYEASFGQLDIQITVTNWVQVGNTHDYYAPESKWGEFAFDAISAADASLDFSQYDNDNDGTVEAIAIIHQGAGQEASYDTNDIWSHMWTLEEAGYSAVQRVFDGVELNTYICQAEDDATGNINTIGMMAHEIGHLLGAPDFYDTDYTNPDYRGTGFWDLQADGSWNGTPMGSQPAHPNIFTKIYYYNWLEASELSSPITINMLATDLGEQAYYFTTTNTNEYFLIENRQHTGFNSMVPGAGLLIYHVDQDYIDAHFEDNDINAAAHMGLYIKDAGNNSNIDDDDCPFPGSSINTQFTDFSAPSALNWSGAPTNKSMTNIAGNYTMTSFDFMGGHGCVPPPLQCSDLTSTAISDNSISLQWTRGMGEKVLLLAKEGSPVDIDPQANIPYIANTEFGLGESLASGIFAMYYEDGNSCVVSGLDAGTEYHFAAYEAFATNNCYTLPAADGSFTTTGTQTALSPLKDMEISIFYNSENLLIDYPEQLKQAHIEIINITGQCIRNEKIRHTVPVSDLPTGVYVLRISIGNQKVYFERFVK
ncbi:MAG: M6 family metalloprotease domain-containing protein [Bacteroidales bacterium]|jgi:M6 family metalloprotease-like protein|nr:M6 family metalloprotease domain-containing protein [Bacteroidales bacterium]